MVKNKEIHSALKREENKNRSSNFVLNSKPKSFNNGNKNKSKLLVQANL